MRSSLLLVPAATLALFTACASVVPSPTAPVTTPSPPPTIAETCESLPANASCSAVLSAAIRLLPEPHGRVVAARVVGVSRSCSGARACPATAGPPTVAYLGLTVEGQRHVVGLEVGITQDGGVVPLS